MALLESLARITSAPLIEPIYDATQMPNRRKWTRAEFARLNEEDGRYELIQGELVKKMGMNGPHANTILLLQSALLQIFGIGYMVRIQLPLIVSETSEPEPDAAIVEGSPRDNPQNNPTSALLCVEVSDSTLASDLGIKASLYAQAEVAEYWVVDIHSRLIHVHRTPIAAAALPNGFGYQTVSRLTENDAISPLAAPQSSISIADLLL